MKKVLIIDDNLNNIRLLTTILEDEGYSVIGIHSSTEAITVVRLQKPDLILLDIMMPGVDGFEICRLLKSEYELMDIPVIMVTAKIEGIDIKRALELGAYDYIKKPIDNIEVAARVKSALNFREQQKRLEEMAMRDSLTGLYNHVLLMELFEKEISKHERDSFCISYAMLDIDFFKKINDSYGHQTGDEILKQLSKLLNESIRKGDILGRYGGEEFGLVLIRTNEDNAYEICEKLRTLVESYKFTTHKGDLNITVSMGICTKGEESSLSRPEMIKLADEALYLAKKSGRNRVELFDASEVSH